MKTPQEIAEDIVNEWGNGAMQNLPITLSLAELALMIYNAIEAERTISDPDNLVPAALPGSELSGSGVPPGPDRGPTVTKHRET